MLNSRYMKWLLSLSMISLGVSFAAEVKAPPPDFSLQWLASPMYSVQKPTGKFQFKTLERFVVTNGISIPVGNITYLSAPNPRPQKLSPQGPHLNEANGDAIIQNIGKVFSIKTWYKRPLRGSFVYEGSWDVTQMYVRVFISGSNSGRYGTTAYSVSMLKKSYADTVGPEAEYLQEGLAGSLEQKSPWLEKMVTQLESQLGISEAFAGENSPGAGSPPSESPGKPKTAPPAVYSSEKEGLVTIQENSRLTELPNDYSQITHAPTRLTGSLAQLNQTTLQSHTVVKPVGSAGRISTAMSSLPNISSNLLVAVPSMGGTTGIAGQALPARADSAFNAAALGIAKAGGVIGLALALTSQPALGIMVAVVSAAVAGVIQAGDLLVDAITHKTEYEELFKTFTQAMDQYANHKSKIEEVEVHLERNLELQKLIKRLGGKEKALQLIGTLDIEHALNIERLKEEAKKNMSGDACKQAAIQTEEKVVFEILLPLVRTYSEEAVCGDLRNVISALIKAEEAMQVARTQILSQVGQQVWAAKLNERYGDLIEENSKDFKKSKNAKVVSEKEARKIYAKQYKSNVQPKAQKAYAACVARRKHDRKKLFSSSEDRNQCKEASDDPRSELAIEFGYADILFALKNSLNTLLTDAKSHQSVLAQQEMTILNPLVHAATFREYNKTFETLQDEQLLSNTNRRLDGLLAQQDTLENACIGTQLKNTYLKCLDRLSKLPQAQNRSAPSATDMKICWEAVNDPDSDWVKEFGYGQSLRHVLHNNRSKDNSIGLLDAHR
jgi:hypothetical protein